MIVGLTYCPYADPKHAGATSDEGRVSNPVRHPAWTGSASRRPFPASSPRSSAAAKEWPGLRDREWYERWPPVHQDPFRHETVVYRRAIDTALLRTKRCRCAHRVVVPTLVRATCNLWYRESFPDV